jgi:hypothetical protein
MAMQGHDGTAINVGTLFNLPGYSKPVPAISLLFRETRTLQLIQIWTI